MRRLNYSNVMATIAVFLSLGAGAYAAVKLKRNAVKSKHIAPNAAKGADIAEESLAKVPSAALADSAATAQSATSAQSIGGITETFVRRSLPDPTNSYVDETIAGLRIGLRCTGGNFDLRFLSASSGHRGSVATVAGATASQTEFDHNVSIPVMGAASAVGSAVQRGSDAGVVRFDFEVRHVANGFGTTDDCFLHGFVRSAT